MIRFWLHTATLQKSALELDRARNNLKRMTLVAPIDGIVVMANVVVNGELRQIRDGDQVSPSRYSILWITAPWS